MEHYYVNNNAQLTGEHEIHKKGCTYFPSKSTYLGSFSSCEEALVKAKTVYENVDGCYTCCKPCHTR